MDEFKIEIVPAIPESFKSHTGISDINNRRGEVLGFIPEKYKILYLLGEDRYGYYPTDILTVLNDLISEIDYFRDRRPHYVSLSGYDVAYATFRQERVWFSDPPKEFGTEEFIELKGEGFPIALAEAAFERTAESVWRYINSQLK